MSKRLLSLLLMLALLLCAAAGLGEQTSVLSAAKISALQRLAGENGALWSEGTPPYSGMNAFQMWQWTDWFLANRVRSLLGALQDVEQLDSDKSLDDPADDDQWTLRKIESTLSRYEAQLEEDRLAIVNGIGLCESGETSQDERRAACERMLEAEREIKEIIAAICRDYQTYLAAVEACDSRLLAKYDSYAERVQSGASGGLATEAQKLENSENAANASFQVSVSSTAQFKIQVVGPSQTPLSGAQVTATNRLNTSKTKTVSTDDQGNAVFWVGDLGADEKSDLRLNLRITANGYRTREAQTVSIRGGETKTYDLPKADGPYLIMACFNGRDILTESRSYYCTKKNTLNHAFTVKLHCDKDGELELRYPVDAKGTQFETVVKKFTAADSDKTVFRFEDQWLHKLPAGAKVSFTIRSGGKSTTTDTKLLIQKAMVDEPFFSKSALFSFTSGVTGLGFNIPSKVPFLSDNRLSFEIPSRLPQVVYTPSHHVMLAWGYDFKPEQANWMSEDAEAQADAIKEFQAKSKTDKALAAAGTYRNVNTTTTWKFLANYGASVTPFVSAQGLYRVSDRSLELRGAAGATLAFKAEATQTFTVGPVPFFAGVDFSMGVSFGMDITLSMTMDVIDGAPKVVKGPDIGYGSGLSISLRLEMGLSGGVGLKKVASLGFRFYGYLNPIVHFTTPKVTADAKLGLGFEVNARLLFIKWHATIWKGELSLGENSAPGLSDQLQTVRLNFDGAQEQQRSAANLTTSAEGLKPSETKKLFNQLDVAADDLQFVQIGTDTYLFWIQPGTGEGLSARLNWYNLSDLSKYLRGEIPDSEVSHGNVAHLVGENGHPLREKNSYMDYAFALEAAGDYCALTILSGKFSAVGSGDEPAPPSQACVATVLMQRNGTNAPSKKGNLDMIGYQEWSTFDQGDYPIMPEVRLLENNSVLSACSTANAPETIYSRLYEHVDNHSDMTGKNLKMKWDPAYEDAAEITRYRIANVSVPDQQTAFYALSRTSMTEEAQSALSRLTVRGDTACTREVLAQGNIISFQVLPGSDTAPDRLFYLEQVQREGQDPVQRLRSVTPDGKKTDYDIETSATFFDVVQLGEGTYLYWAECCDDSPNTPESEKKYLVRCVRYDPGTDTVFGPFSLVELTERPNIVKLLGATTGYYSVEKDPENANVSYQRCSVSQFSYALIRSVQLTSAVLLDPCVSAGDFADLSFSVRNTGSVPISALKLQIFDKPTNATSTTVQTLHLDLDNPEESSNTFHLTGSSPRTLNTETVVRRLGNQHDSLNQEDWTITTTTASGATVRSVRTDLLLPGDARSYQTKIQIPASWAGGKTLVAQITDVTGEASLSSTSTANGLLLMGKPSNSRTAATEPVMRTYSEIPIDTDAHDLMLRAQRFERDGEDYVHVTIHNRSGNTASDVIPVLTARFRGQTLFTHVFKEKMGDDFGYAMDIPLKTLTNSRSLPELDLYVSGGKANGKDYEDFADADNHVRLLLIAQLCIVEHPQSIPVSEKAEAVFTVTAAGGYPPYRYQWQRMTGTDRWENIPGAHSDTYRIASVGYAQNGLTVRCVVTDQFGDSVTSDPAVLSILPQTGDRAQPGLWLLLALASACALALAMKRRRKS